MRSAPAWAAAALLLVATGCQHLPSPRAIPACPGTLVDTAEMGDDFRWRASVRSTHRDTTFDFELVAEKRSGELVLVGLHPLGAQLFSVSQRGDDVAVDALPGAVLPVPPKSTVSPRTGSKAIAWRRPRSGVKVGLSCSH